MPSIVTAEVPVLVRVRFCVDELPSLVLAFNVRLVGKLMYVPIPLKFTTCGLVGSLSVIVKVPVSGPDTVGVKTMLMLHSTVGFSELPQVLLCVKSPVVASPEIVTFLPVKLVKLTVYAGLGLPT